MIHLTADIVQRYERFVIRREGCWDWSGAKRTRGGYGRMKGGYAHRISWAIHHGPIPAGLLVLHRCDNPPCSNPDHLFLGTQKDNMADAAAKGRLANRPNRASGERVGSSKLTATKARQIRELCAAGRTRRSVATQFGVNQASVSNVVLGKTWRSA